MTQDEMIVRLKLRVCNGLMANSKTLEFALVAAQVYQECGLDVFQARISRYIFQERISRYIRQIKHVVGLMERYEKGGEISINEAMAIITLWNESQVNGFDYNRPKIVLHATDIIVQSNRSGEMPPLITKGR